MPFRYDRYPFNFFLISGTVHLKFRSSMDMRIDPTTQTYCVELCARVFNKVYQRACYILMYYLDIDFQQTLVLFVMLMT